MDKDEKTIYTLNVGTDKRVVESGVSVTKEEIETQPDLVKSRLIEKLSVQVSQAVEQLFGPENPKAVPVEEKKEEPKEEKKEEPKEEKKEEPKKEEEKPAEEKEEEKKEEPAEEKKEEPKEEKKEEVKEEPKKDAA